jgi:hypothetical protein
MKSLTGLWKAMAEDYSVTCDTPIDRDYKTVCDRVEEEGRSFLTITLPNFCADFETSLAQGFVGSNLFAGFRKRGGLPRFLSGFLLQIFDGQSLALLENPSVFAVRAIRNLTLLFKKVELDCTDARNAAALEKYLNCEVDLQKVLDRYDTLPIKEFKRMSSVLFGSVFDSLNRKVREFDLRPGHGPGATADRKVGNQKFDQTEWTDRLEEYFPFGEYALPHWKWFSSHKPVYLAPAQERPVKIALVPKTLKTPRIIAIEPTCMQYMQKALMREFVDAIESDPLVGRHTHFREQALNRDAARRGSADGSLATLDLSEASDRVLNQLVIDMLSPWPDLLGAVQACRSTSAELPSGQVVPLVKFASMGSALTFPMEAVVFTTIVFMGLLATQGDSVPSAEFMRSIRNDVHVYGDDMIVPVGSVNEVVRLLELFGLVVNRSKSFETGLFRESCGGDYFMGESVKPIRLKRIPPTSRQDVPEIVTWNAFMNASYEAGLNRTGRYVQGILEKVLHQHLPMIPIGSGAIGVEVPAILCVADRLDPMTHLPQVRALRAVDEDRKISVDGVWALQKTLTGRWSDPAFARHLTHSGRPLSSRIKRSWVPIR